MAGGARHRAAAALDIRHPFLERSHCRVADARVDVPECLQIEE